MAVGQKRLDARQQGMIELLERHGGLSVSRLARHFSCSTATVRRDLARIEDSGVALMRHHGSVSLVREDLGSQFEARRIAHFAEKEAIARLVADFIPDHATIGLNGGTTTMLIARALAKTGRPVRVVTNAINIAYELALKSQDVVVVGGQVQLPHFESTGKVALNMLEQLHLDLAVLGVEGADAGFGFSTAREEEAAIAEVFRASADRVLTAWDGSKFGRKELFRLLDWSQVDYVATDTEGGKWLKALPGVAVEQRQAEAGIWRVAAS